METPNSVASAPDLSSAVDAAFDIATAGNDTPAESTPDTAVEDTPAEPVAEPEAQQDAAPPVEPDAPAEPPADAAAAPDALADDLDDPSEVKPDQITERGGKKFYHYTEQKAHRLLQASDFMRGVQERIPNATPEAIEQYYTKAVEYQQFMADFDIGGPEQVTGWTNYMFGREANPESVAIVAQNFVSPQFAQTHPKAYGVIRSNLLNSEIQRLYRAGMQNEATFALAQNLDAALNNGRFLEKSDLAKQSDPYALERQRFEQQKAEFEQQQRQSAQQRVQQWMQETDGAVSAGEDAAITEGLKVATDKGNYSPRQIEFMKFELRKAIEEAKKSRPAFMREFEVAKQQARANPSGESRNRLVSMMRQFVQPIVAQHRKGVIAEATGAVVSANAAAHQQQQQMARRVEPNATPAPASRQSGLEKLRSAKTLDEAMDVFLA